ncbi:hypothetical protein A8F94_15345 [Bacillus sp. FJAT-27225]|uniref:DUF6843 domain-containing protein n=1 Tax=Bacillus sp. FJAT-27225 TaxID=1743144 RepID=UPI00080C2DF6|nr:hypothetical protein [Bacillus sp. FJAT-27225]OCA84099.1 hypothetical protein A8F94_15345 [Bacillus sp. FJAT-27225]
MWKMMMGVIGVLIIGGILIFYQGIPKTALYNEEYAIPEGFKGCVHVVFNVKGGPPLEVVDGNIVHKIAKNGISVTSSPEDFGWADKEGSGAYQEIFYYVNEEGKKTNDIKHEQIFNAGLGSFEEGGVVQLTHYHFSVNDKNEYCTDIDELREIIKNFKVIKSYFLG